MHTGTGVFGVPIYGPGTCRNVVHTYFCIGWDALQGGVDPSPTPRLDVVQSFCFSFGLEKDQQKLPEEKPVWGRTRTGSQGFLGCEARGNCELSCCYYAISDLEL